MIDTSPSISEQITIDFGQSKSCDFVVLGGLLAEEAAITLQGSTDNVSYSAVTTIGAGSTAEKVLKEFSSTSYRYWRINFVEIGTFSRLEVGNIFLGLKVELDHNFELLDTRDSRIFQGLINKSLTGYKSSVKQQTSPTKMLSYKYDYATNAEKNSLEDFLDYILATDTYSVLPFYFYEDDLNFARLIGGLEFSPLAYDVWETIFNLETEM
jgi:hypothetical protein